MCSSFKRYFVTESGQTNKHPKSLPFLVAGIGVLFPVMRMLMAATWDCELLMADQQCPGGWSVCLITPHPLADRWGVCDPSYFEIIGGYIASTFSWIVIPFISSVLLVEKTLAALPKTPLIAFWIAIALGLAIWPICIFGLGIPLDELFRKGEL